MWLALSGAAGADLDFGGDPPPAGWRLALPGGQQAVIWRDGGDQPLVVKTVLDAVQGAAGTASSPIERAGAGGPSAAFLANPERQ